MVINTRALIESQMSSISTSKYSVTTMKYAEKPISENADLSRNDIHNPKPLMVPISGP